MLKLPRKALGEMIQTITGHAHLQKHNVLTGDSTSAECRICQIPNTKETPWHLLTECLGTLRRRVEIIGLDQSLDQTQWKVYQLSTLIEAVIGPLIQPRVEQIV